jgi:hypothetical protein
MAASAEEVAKALAYLQVHSPEDGTSLYEHLVSLVSKVRASLAAYAIHA